MSTPKSVYESLQQEGEIAFFKQCQLSQLATVQFMEGLNPYTIIKTVHGEMLPLTASISLSYEMTEQGNFEVIKDVLVKALTKAIDKEALHSDKFLVKPMTVHNMLFQRLEAPNYLVYTSPNYRVAVDNRQLYKLMGLYYFYEQERIKGMSNLELVKTRIDFNDHNYRVINYKDSLLVNPSFNVYYDAITDSMTMNFSARLLLVGFLVPDELGG